jgi:serine/threonine-protein kinase
MAERAIAALQRLRPDSAEAHLALAAHVYTAYRDYDRARAELALAGRRLPNEPLVSELTGYIDRRQGRWEEALRELRRASELDPRNFFILQQISLACENMRLFPEAIEAMDRVLAIAPNDPGSQVVRAGLELESRADIAPVQKVIKKLLEEQPDTATGIAGNWHYLALCLRDAGEGKRALAAMTSDGCRQEGLPLPKMWCEGLTDRSVNDEKGAREAFTKARAEIEKLVNAQPDYAEALFVLGLIDAGLGRKEDAIAEGERAIALMPVNRDAINGGLMQGYLAIIYAWTGQKDRAFAQLKKAVTIPNDVCYGQLKLHPYWDPLRGDPRFDEIVTATAPK